MGRVWRLDCPRNIRLLQQSALTTTTLYLLRQTGPFAYVIQEEHKKEPYRVCLGERHTCTCRDHKLTRDICIHICWVLLRKLKIKPVDPLAYQTGLVTRELNQVLNPEESPQPKKQKKLRDSDFLLTAPRRPIKSDDACPICLEPFNNRKSSSKIVFCQYSCGNAVHFKCMVVLAQYQIKAYKEQINKHEESASLTRIMLSCPLCRGDFSLASDLASAKVISPQEPPKRPEPAIHTDVTCRICLANPVIGSLFRCVTCPLVIICGKCLHENSFGKLHLTHGVIVKQKPNERWQLFDVKQHRKKRDHFLPKISYNPIYTQDQAERSPSPEYTPPTELVNKGTQHTLIDEHEMALECGNPYHVPTVESWLRNSSVSLLDGPPITAPKLRRNKSGRLCNTYSPPKLPPPEVRVNRIELFDRKNLAPISNSSSLPAERPPYSTLIERPCRSSRSRQVGDSNRKSTVKGKRVRSKATSTTKETKIVNFRDSVEQPPIEPIKEKEPSGRARLSVQEMDGRNLGAKVQPLLAILMSPTNNMRSQSDDSGSGNGDSSTEGSARLKVTMIELPLELEAEREEERRLEVIRRRRRRIGQTQSAKRWLYRSKSAKPDKKADLYREYTDREDIIED